MGAKNYGLGHVRDANTRDVEDKLALSEYWAKREEWLRWYSLNEQEPNSIQQQIFSMIFLDIVYRVLAEPRRDGTEGLKIAAKNGLLARFLDQGYVALQVLAIRRLLEQSSDKRSKGVISVRRLLDDISANRRLLTREIYVCHDGLPYEPRLESLHENPSTTLGLPSPEHGDPIRADARHKTFDRLSGVSAGRRSRSDLIKESVFCRLRQWLENEPAQRLIELSHKFFAHAADMDSRGSLGYSGISPDAVAEAHRAIIQVERAITDQILGIGYAGDVVPMWPLDLLVELDSPYASTDLVKDMDHRLRELSRERNEWSKGILDELLADEL